MFADLKRRWNRKRPSMMRPGMATSWLFFFAHLIGFNEVSRKANAPAASVQTRSFCLPRWKFSKRRLPPFISASC